MVRETNQSGPETGKHPDHFLAEWREFRGLSQRELGDMIGASHSKISRIETGESELRASFAKKLAAFFKVPIEALFTINPMGDGRQTAEMLTVWGNIDPKNRDHVMRMMKAFERGGGSGGKS